MLPPQHEIERLLAGRNTAETERREATTPADHGAVLRALDTKDRSRKALRGADCRDLKLTMSAFHARIARRRGPRGPMFEVRARRLRAAGARETKMYGVPTAGPGACRRRSP